MMKMKVLIVLFLLSPLFISAQHLVSYNKTEDVDFGKFKTFQVYSLDVKSYPEFKPNEEGLNLLISEINKQMEIRGYQKVNADPDLLINIGVVISKEQQTRETDIRDAPMYIGQRNYHWESEEIVVGTYTAGSVVLDIINTITDEMVWQAVSKGVISDKKPEKNKKKITKGVAKLFKKYPVKIQ
ncbi:DUF4136 domain-containing protein [Flavobacteriaceae bacterium D16]|nr:DUF4136 domain-containing protein [Flavobacteriaceae bacterium D16]